MNNYDTIIMAASKVTADLQAEFGSIAPWALPLGQSNLLEKQVEWISRFSTGRILLVTAAGDSPPSLDCLSHMVIPDGLTLSKAVFKAVAQYSEDTSDLAAPLQLLYGDALFSEVPSDQEDFVAVDAPPIRFQGWQKALGDTVGSVVAGFFRFSSITDLVRCCLEYDASFEHVLERYYSEKSAEYGSLGWLDFGHAHSYFSSKKRFFNTRTTQAISASPNPYWITKKSKDISVANEYHWYSLMSHNEISVYTPRAIRESLNSIRLEYVSSPSLAELDRCNLDDAQWDNIYRRVIEFLETLYTTPVPSSELHHPNDHTWRLIEKNRKRHNDYMGLLGADNKSFVVNGQSVLYESVLELEKFIDTTEILRPWHGDMVFSNILYDRFNDRVVVVDPRPDYKSKFMPVGNIQYDLAKLVQSAVLKYDRIVSKVPLSKHDNTQHGYANITLDFHIPDRLLSFMKKYSVNEDSVLALAAYLLVAAAPLHYPESPERSDVFYKVAALTLNYLRTK